MKTKTTLIITAFFIVNALILAQEYHEAVKLQSPDFDPYDYYGNTVSISGNYAIVGASGETEDASGGNTMSGAGSAYIYQRDADGNWNEIQKLVASDRYLQDHFGSAVSISGNYAVVGAPDEDHNATGGYYIKCAGSVYIFERDVYGNWQEVQKIVASDRSEWDYFGESISISGHTIIVGTPFEDHNAAGENEKTSAGAAYIFTRDVNGHWNEVQKIVASDRDVHDFFGYSVDISGNYAVVGAYLEDEDESGENTLENDEPLIFLS